MDAPVRQPSSGSSVGVQAFGILLEALRERAIPLQPLFEGLSVGLDDVGVRGGRVPWDDFALFLCRFEEALGPEIYLTLGEAFLRRDEYGAFRRVMRLAISPRLGFMALNRWFGPRTFPLVNSEITFCGANDVRMTMRIPEPFRDAPGFFLLNKIAFQAVGQMLSGRPARVTLELRPREARYQIQLPPSRTIWAWLRRLRNFMLPDARLMAVLNEQQDDLRETVAALRQSESRYRHLVEQSRVGIWRLDPQTQRLIFVSAASMELLGYEPEELKAMELDQIVLLDDMPIVEAMLGELSVQAGTDERLVREVRHVHKAGHIVWCEVHAAAIRDEWGKVEAIQGVTHDITVRKEVERERARTATAEKERDLAEGANRLKDSILAGMSHEIRTPLTSQIGFTQLLLRDLAGTPHEKHLRVVDRNSRRLLALLDNMLELARLEAENVPAETRVYSIGQTVEQVMDLVRLQAEEKGLSLSLSVSGELRVCSDARRDEQIFLNTIGNAIRYTDRGSIRVEGRRVADEGGAKGWVEIRISDTGIGMAPEFLPHAFEDFRQELEGSQNSKGGTGLGLAIARRLMSSVGGRIAIESRKNLGTTVILHFPGA